MSNLRALLDADLLVYRCGFSAEKKIYIPHINGEPRAELASAKELKEWMLQQTDEEIEVEHRKIVQPLAFALGNVKTTIAAIQAVVGQSCEFYLSGGGNFRKALATIRPYKGNRGEFDRPIYYDQIRDYLINVWKAEVVEGEEADDAIGVRAKEITSNQGKESKYKSASKEEGLIPIVVSIDKDLLQIPAFHYNWVKGEKAKVTPAQGLKFFYQQLLTGDDTDNIAGLRGVGEKTAIKMLGDLTKEKALFSCVREAWHKHFPSGVTRHDGSVIGVDEALLETGRLLYIRQNEGEVWQFPK